MFNITIIDIVLVLFIGFIMYYLIKVVDSLVDLLLDTINLWNFNRKNKNVKS